jgi:serine/threonine protein kinase
MKFQEFLQFCNFAKVPTNQNKTPGKSQPIKIRSAVFLTNHQLPLKMYTVDNYQEISFQKYDVKQMQFKISGKKTFIECKDSKFSTPKIFSYVRKDVESLHLEDNQDFRECYEETRFFKEVEALHHLSAKSKNLVQFKGWLEKDSKFYIITESIFDYTSLQDCFKAKEFSFASMETIDICAQVAGVISLFHEQKFIYRNLNLDNILVT